MDDRTLFELFILFSVLAFFIFYVIFTKRLKKDSVILTKTGYKVINDYSTDWTVIEVQDWPERNRVILSFRNDLGQTKKVSIIRNKVVDLMEVGRLNREDYEIIGESNARKRI